MTKVCCWKNRVKRELMGYIITKTNCKLSSFYIHVIIANMQNICMSTGSGISYTSRNDVQEGFFRDKEPYLCVEDLLLTSFSM